MSVVVGALAIAVFGFAIAGGVLRLWMRRDDIEETRLHQALDRDKWGPF